MIDRQLRQKVATAVKRSLSANAPGESSVNSMEATLTTVIMRTDELVFSPSRSEGDQGGVEAETPKRKLNCRHQLMGCMHPGSA